MGAYRAVSQPAVTHAIPPLDQWDPDWRYRYEERAAIKEFDGGTPRARAEAEALEETWAEYLRDK